MTTITYTATEFSSVEDKTKFRMQLIAFVEGGFPQEQFTNALYKHLSNCFGHIAHFNRDGFYTTWFRSPEAQLEFCEHLLTWRCYGDPAFTFCDVEKDLQRWLRGADVIANLKQTIQASTEARERAELARLQTKYGEKA